MVDDLQLEVTTPARERAAYVMELFREALGTPLPLSYGVERATQWRITVHADEALGTGGVQPGDPLPPMRPIWDELGRRSMAVGSIGGPPPPPGARVLWWTTEGDRTEAAGWWGEGRLVLRFDLALSAFYFLSGWEELAAGTPDRHGRYTAAERREMALTVLEAPVHFYARVLERSLDLLYAGAPWYAMARWPGGVPFVAGLSHDIDLLRRLGHEHGVTRDDLRDGLEKLREGQLVSGTQKLARATWHLASGRNPYWTFDHICSLEAETNARSSFYFLAGPEAPRPVDDPEMMALFHELKTRGFEIGLHGGLEAAEEINMLKIELRRLKTATGAPVEGIRQHYLKLQRSGQGRAGTWIRQVEAGLKYDSSLGYADQEGFRAGWGLPFAPWEFGMEQALPLLEIPLIVMDGTLMTAPGGNAYRDLDPTQAWRAVETMLERCVEYGAALTVLWHNTAFCALDLPDYQAIYPRLLKEIATRGGRGMAVGEINNWWRQRGQLRLVRGGDGEWRIEHRGIDPVEGIVLRAEDGRSIPLASMHPGEVRMLEGGYARE